jgi:hypothetical protein
MNNRNARFGRGSGVYTCRTCGRKTRQTGGDNHSVGLCEECYEIAGLENSLADNRPPWTPEKCKAEILRLTELCKSKGGKL